MPSRQHGARAIVFPVDVTLLAQANIAGEGLMGTNMFQPLAPEGEKFPGMLETVDHESFPRTLKVCGVAKPIFYRADMRPDIETFVSKEFYKDGDLHLRNLRKKKPKGEIAFADSIGGAVYGAVQFRHHEAMEDIVPEDFLDDDVEYYIHIYGTNKQYDYSPETSQIDSWLNTEDDLGVTGEVRYFDEVPVRYLGKIPITKAEIAILSTLIYKGRTVADFDFEVEGDYDKGIESVIAGDKEFIRKHLLPWPGKEIPMNGEYAEGINIDLAMKMVEHFNRKWEKIHKTEKLKAHGIGQGWHHESSRHALAARGIRTR